MVIRLRDMWFHAFHGVLRHEKTEGNTFRVSVCLTLPDTVGAQTDDIAQTVDYREVYRLVAQEMAQPADLIEHVAWRIRQALQSAFPQAEGVSVVVGKKMPPLGGEVEWAEVEI